MTATPAATEFPGFPKTLARAGASEERIMYSLSSRCIMNGSQASPLSIHSTFSFGKRSGSPLMTQLVMWIRL